MGNLNIKKKITELIQTGLSFQISEDKLLVKGDLSLLDDEDREFLKANKKEVITLIENQIDQGGTVIRKSSNNTPKFLSYSQQSLWLLDKINNGSHQYNLISAFRLYGEVDYKALNHTFLTILQRHESLRSYFSVDKSGKPIQKIQSVDNYNIEVEELDSTIENYEVQIERKIEEEKHRIFDLSRDVLLCTRLFKLNLKEHILVVNMHHIASDGWSVGILVKEFNILYASYVNGENNPLSELKIQYSDYADWQRKYLSGNNLKEYTNFWKKQLSGLPLLHNLPTDKPRPIEQSFNGDVYRSIVNKDLLESLYDLCKSETASLFMGIQAAFSILLARYSNETDIVIGSPIANRENSETADLVGFFMNLLVLRSDLSQNPTFKELLRQTKKKLEKAYQYQQMPYEKLVEDLEIQRNLSHNPLFQILLTLHNNQGEEFSLPKLTMEEIESKTNSAKYDLTLNVNESSEGLLLAWEYNTDLFEKPTIERMAMNFNTLITSLLGNPNETVFKVNMVAAEENKIHKFLKGKIVDVDSEVGVIHSFDHHVRTIPNENAIICNDISYSYKQLGEKTDSIASSLINKGVLKGDKVGVCLLRNTDLVATIFACLKIGAVYIPLDPVYSSERINKIIEDVQPKCIVTLKPLEKLYLNGITKTTFVCLDKLVFLDENRVIESHPNNIETAYIIFTSGTTGKPKGIEITHGNLKNFLRGFDESFGSGAKQRWLAQTSVNFDISILELIWTISRGHSIVLQQTNPLKLLSPNRLHTAGKMDFSMMFFGADKNNYEKYKLLLDTAKFADKNNFSAIWTPERHFGEFGGAFASPSVLGSALSVITEKINIRAGSVVLPLHDPIRVAEEWSIVDNLSNGRIGVSIASGWHPNDFVLSGSNYKERHTSMRDKISELKDLWQGNPLIRKNGVDKDFSIKIRPAPIQKELPLWITAAGNPETFRYAGSIGANLLTHMLGQSQEKLAENIEIYHQALKDNGFRHEDKHVSLMLHTYIDSTEQIALGISEKPFKEYLGSSIKLMEPLANELGLNVNTQSEELIKIAFEKFSSENTLIGSPESCQEMLHSIQSIGVTEIACLVDFGIENEKVFAGFEKIVETREHYHSYVELMKHLNLDNQKTELDLISDHKVTHVQMTPSQTKLVLDLYNQTEDKDLSSVKHWFIGGEALNQKLIIDLSAVTNCKLYNMYGPTETTVWSAWREINKEDLNIGKPIINTELLLLNEFEQQVPIGVIGELYIGGAGVGKGYYKNKKLTDKNFKDIGDSNYRGRFYGTGDLMKMNNNGNFEYVARRDNQVKVNGYRIEIEDLEETILKVPGVKNCKVLPIKNDYETFLSAYVVKEDIVYGDFKALAPEKKAKPFSFPDGSTIYHQSDRQLAMLYKEIIEDGIYFKYGISVPENGVVLDIGANIGTFSIDVSQRQPSATIIAFEPIPQIFSALKENFEHRGINGCVMNYGVSSQKENATFFYYPEMAGMSGRFADKETIVNAVENYIEHDKELLKEETDNWSEGKRKILRSFYENMDDSEDFSEELKQYLSSIYASEEVECQLTTVSNVIDELDIKAIDLLKLDVEKSECLVLEGIRAEHWSMIKHLAIEVDGDNNLRTIVGLLNEKGYVLNVDELVMSDVNTPKEENTYMVYATNNNHGLKPNDTVKDHLQLQVDERLIREFLGRKLPIYMSPKDINFVPSIPLTENGKVDIIKLKEFKPRKLELNNKVKLTNKTEIDIYQIWCEVLETENIPNHISIFEAGGNSMKIVLLHEKLQTKFKVNFSLIELFRNPTIPQQAKLIQNSGNQDNISSKKATSKGLARRNARSKKIK